MLYSAFTYIYPPAFPTDFSGLFESNFILIFLSFSLTGISSSSFPIVSLATCRLFSVLKAYSYWCYLKWFWQDACWTSSVSIVLSIISMRYWGRTPGGLLHVSLFLKQKPDSNLILLLHNLWLLLLVIRLTHLSKLVLSNAFALTLKFLPFLLSSCRLLSGDLQ